MNKARDAWRAATRYEELCSLAAAFLTGGIDHFPGWGAGDTDEETDEVEGLLTSCCLGGFLAVASPVSSTHLTAPATPPLQAPSGRAPPATPECGCLLYREAGLWLDDLLSNTSS